MNCNTYLLLWLSSLHYFCLEGFMSYYSNKKKKKRKQAEVLKPKNSAHTQSVQWASSICRSIITNIANTFHHYCNSITAFVVASETREKTKLKRNHSMWIGLTLIDMTLIIRQYSMTWSKLHSPLWRYTICSNLSYNQNKLGLQQYRVKCPYSPILLQNKSVFPLEMYCFCHCFLYSRTECIM